MRRYYLTSIMIGLTAMLSLSRALCSEKPALRYTPQEIHSLLDKGDITSLKRAYALTREAGQGDDYEHWRLSTYAAGQLWHNDAASASLEEILENAQKWLTQSLRQDQKDEATNYIAHVLIEMNEPRKALELLKTLNDTIGKSPTNLYWIGRLASLDNEERAYGRHCLEELSFLFPTHPLASEALLLLHEPRKYMAGDHEAMKTLHTIVERYPLTSAAALAHYFLALNHWNRAIHGHGFLTKTPRHLKQAGRSYLTAASLANSLSAKDNTLKFTAGLRNALLWVQGFSLLGRSQTIEKLMQHPTVLQKHEYLLEGIGNTDALLAFLEKVPQDADSELWLGTLQRQALCQLIRLQCQLGDISNALSTSETLISLINTKESSGIKRDCLSALYPLIKALIGDEQTELSEYWLNKCDELTRDLEDDELLLRLWLVKAQHSQQKGDDHGAMLTLSKIINSPVASSLRVEAMLLRADIYLREDRREQAIKQLEAVKARGGSWSVHAEKEIQRLRG